MERVLFKSKADVKSQPAKGGILGLLVQVSMLALSLFLLYNVFKSIQITTQKLEILKQAESEVDQLRIENIELILRKETFQSDDYIETEARNRLNYSKNGEVLFVIPDSTMQIAHAELEQILSPGEPTIPLQKVVWEKWLDFFILGV